MKGVILAAGRGARLNGGNSEMPKCLVTMGGETLLSRNIRLLRDAGIDDVAVVVGCAADTVRRTCSDVTFVDNSRFAQTNSLYSLWLARPLLTDGFVVMNCDVLLHPQLLSDLLTALTAVPGLGPNAAHHVALRLGHRALAATYLLTDKQSPYAAAPSDPAVA